MRIYVKMRDIRRGCKGSGSDCPIAEAVKRALGMKGGVHVANEKITVCRVKPGGGLDLRTMELPSEAKTFIRRFDGQSKPAPFSFELDL